MKSFLPDDVFLIVGLGNPGSEYIATRHNFGFIAVDFLSKKIDTTGSFTFVEEFQAEILLGKLAGKPVALLKPQTFMNCSGVALRALLERQEDFDPRRIIVIHDDLDLDLGRIKLKQNGGSGGHNGLKSLIKEIGRADFLRLRLGIAGDARGNIHDMVDFVLGHFSKSELEVVEDVNQRLHSGLMQFFNFGLVAAMNQLNCRIMSDEVCK